MSRFLMYEIDGEKLERALLSRGASLKEAAEELGYSKYFFYNCRSRGVINRTAMVSLSVRYGINLEDIKKEEPEILRVMQEAQKEEPNEDAVHADPIDYKRLWTIFYTATKKAVEEALKGE